MKRSHAVLSVLMALVLTISGSVFAACGSGGSGNSGSSTERTEKSGTEKSDNSGTSGGSNSGASGSRRKKLWTLGVKEELQNGFEHSGVKEELRFFVRSLM